MTANQIQHRAQIKLLHVDPEDAHYCLPCWEASLKLKPLGSSEEFEELPEDSQAWCEFALTHKSVYEE